MMEAGRPWQMRSGQGIISDFKGYQAIGIKGWRSCRSRMALLGRDGSAATLKRGAAAKSHNPPSANRERLLSLKIAYYPFTPWQPLPPGSLCFSVVIPPAHKKRPAGRGQRVVSFALCALSPSDDDGEREPRRRSSAGCRKWAPERRRHRQDRAWADRDQPGQGRDPDRRRRRCPRQCRSW